MSKYNAQRKRNLYDTTSKKPFKISWSKISLYKKCPRCFYLDRRLGVGQPPGYPFTLNMAVDALLKREFDAYRDQGLPHPLMIEARLSGIVPAWFGGKLEDWRNTWKGVQCLHEPTNLIITGAIDDLWWKAKSKEAFVVDYKATSKKESVTEINPDYGYKEQMEVYQWLLRKKGLTISNTGYFIYANGRKDMALFEEKLHFDMTLIACEGDDSWVEPTIMEISDCLKSNTIPPVAADCDHCAYIAAVEKHVGG